MNVTVPQPDARRGEGGAPLARPASRAGRWFRCAACRRCFPTARSRCRTCRSTWRRESSSACSGRRGAASRRRSASSPASASRRPARSNGRPPTHDAAGHPQREIGFVFQEPTLMPWATVFNNVWLPLRLRHRSKAVVAGRGHGGARDGRARAFRRCLSARALRRHEDARLDRARPDHQAEASPHGRAVRRARRDHPLQAQQRSSASVGEVRLDGHLRHPLGLRVRLSVRADRGDGGAAGAGLQRAQDRGPLPARGGVPHLGGLQRVLPADLGGAARRHGGERVAR